MDIFGPQEQHDVNVRRALILHALPVYLREDASKFFMTCNVSNTVLSIPEDYSRKEVQQTLNSEITDRFLWSTQDYTYRSFISNQTRAVC